MSSLQVCLALLQATKGKQKLAFFTMPEYEAWKETAAPGWTVKYYKGLGTSDKKEAQEYFADIDLHRKTFVHEGSPQLSALTTCASPACRPVHVHVRVFRGTMCLRKVCQASLPEKVLRMYRPEQMHWCAWTGCLTLYLLV